MWLWLQHLQRQYIQHDIKLELTPELYQEYNANETDVLEPLLDNMLVAQNETQAKILQDQFKMERSGYAHDRYDSTEYADTLQPSTSQEQQGATQQPVRFIRHTQTHTYTHTMS
jgi:hypothetical protein